MADITVLDVLLNGREIGTLTDFGGGRILFAFSQDYIDDPERPTLSLSFKDSLGGLITDIPPTDGRVPPFFANLLPEGPLRDYLTQRAGVEGQGDFFLLKALGRDLPGAVEVREATTGVPVSDDESAAADVRNQILENALRFSLAGVQLKFSVVMEVAGALTIPAQGVGGGWIIKLPSSRYHNVPENEFSMMTLADAMGMEVPEVKLVPFEQISGLPDEIGHLEGSALAIKRFDRPADGGAVHIEDFAQVFSVYPEEKYRRATYRNIAQVIWAEIGEDGITEYIRRLVFCVLTGNADMHLKNWSLIYTDGRAAALSPSYDFVSTVPYIADDTMALKLDQSASVLDFGSDRLARFAARAGLPETMVLDVARDTVERFHDAWRNFRPHLPLPDDIVKSIDAHVAKIPLANE
jgi:serine/threonine-protein kinase HipA